jgi:hypothetical protein
MPISDMLRGLRYVTDLNGERTDVIVPLESWRLLIESWQRMAEILEERGEIGLLESWIASRTASQDEPPNLDDFERRFKGNGFLSE